MGRWGIQAPFLGPGDLVGSLGWIFLIIFTFWEGRREGDTKYRQRSELWQVLRNPVRKASRRMAWEWLRGICVILVLRKDLSGEGSGELRLSAQMTKPVTALQAQESRGSLCSTCTIKALEGSSKTIYWASVTGLELLKACCVYFLLSSYINPVRCLLPLSLVLQVWKLNPKGVKQLVQEFAANGEERDLAGSQVPLLTIWGISM